VRAASPLRDPRFLLHWLSVAGTVVAVLALAELTARAWLQLDASYDTFSYHAPFAALRAGVPISFDLTNHFRQMFDGFPPLADLAQGTAWRLLGSINAIQLVNALALVGFAIYCRVVLRASFWLVTLIALTAPLVAIHASVGYVDLFSNVFLAIGASSALALLLWPERATRAVYVGGLIGLVVACWSKFTVVPIAVPLFVAYLPLGWRAAPALRLERSTIAAILGVVIVVAAVPYVRNLWLFGNPFWPVKVPFVGSLLPYAADAEANGVALNRPPALRDAPQWLVFVRSLFEVDVPTSYGFRPRWTIDQYVGTRALIGGLRMGGFWNVGVVVFLGTTLAALVAVGRRRGVVAAVAVLATLALVAFLPQSNELRYVLFLPLTWAAALGMLVPQLAASRPIIGVGFGVVVLLLFGFMLRADRSYYEIRPGGWVDVATVRGGAAVWPQLSRGTTYCTVGLTGTDFFMTGPTMNDFRIDGRDTPAGCPSGSVLLTPDGIVGQP
jgi:hypothetical protein